VNYTQIGACNGFMSTSNNLVSAGGNAAFLVFRVDSIDNSQSSIPYNFDPTRLSVNGTSPSAHIDPGLTLASTIGVFQAPAETVAAKQVVQVHGFGVTVVPTSGGDPAAVANKINYFLTYNTVSGDPSVVTTKLNASTTSYPGNDNCLAMSYPLSLQQTRGASLQASAQHVRPPEKQ